MHQVLSVAPDGLPYMQIHPNCYSIIATLPELVYDEDHSEDIADGQDDHDYDSLSYGLMTLKPTIEKPKLINTQIPDQPGLPRVWAVTPEGQIKTDDILKSLAAKDLISKEPEA